MTKIVTIQDLLDILDADDGPQYALIYQDGSGHISAGYFDNDESNTIILSFEDIRDVRVQEVKTYNLTT